MMDIISLFRSKDTPQMSYDFISKLKPFEKVKVSEGVKAYRMPIHGDTHLVVFKYLESGAETKKHYHDCKEVVQVVKGKIAYKGKTYESGAKLFIHKGVTHSFKALEETKLFVEYFKARK